MPYCPVCNSEFREGITFCANCEVDLVDVLTEENTRMDDDAMEEYLSDKEVTVIGRSSIDTMKRIKGLLCSRNIANILFRDSGCASGGCSPTVSLAVAVEDIPRVQDVLQSDFQALLNTVDCESAAGGCSAVDLSASEIECPACGRMFEAGEQECPECGLYLGVPDDL